MTAFVRRYSARIAALICTVRQHDWTRWATKYDTSKPPVISTYGERKCRRCGRLEVGAAPKRARRASNAADTIQTKG